MTRDDADRDFDAISEEEIFEEAKDRLHLANEAYSHNRQEAKADILFREGDQWDHDTTTTASEDTPELTINLTDAYVTRVENNIKQQRPRGKCHPVGDGADVELAEIINGIGRHIETRSEASVAYDTAAKCALTAGEGYFRIIAEYVSPTSFLKDLRILPIRNIFTVHMDPAAIMPSGADQMWCLISVKMKRTEYKRRYPDAKNISFNDLTREESRLDWEDKEEIRLAEYFRIREKAETLFLLRNLQGQEFTKWRSEMPREPNSKFSLEYATNLLASQGISIEDKRDSSKQQVEWFRLNGTKVVERQQIPGQWIPVFRVEGNATDVDGRILRRGMVRAMKDAARMVNYGEVAKIKRLGLTPKAPWVAAEGQLDGHPEWDDANMRPYSVLTYKPIVVETSGGAQLLPPPARQMPAQLEQGFAEFTAGMRSNLLAIAGMPNEPGQDQQGQVVSGVALKRRQGVSDQSHYQYYDQLTLAIAQCWRVMVDWIPHYYSEERIQRIIGEDSTPEMVPINKPEMDEQGAVSKIKNDLSVGRYDVVMDTGPGYETKREEGAENLINLLGVAPLAELIAKTGADLVFRSIDHPYMQEMADRLMAANPEGLQKIMEGLSNRARSIVQALANENTALKQQVQQLATDLKAGLSKTEMIAAAKVHDTQVMAHTKIHDTQVRADTALAIEHARGGVALAVEEVRAGGELLNTHIEAAHHRAEAERMMEAAERAEKKPNGAGK